MRRLYLALSVMTLACSRTLPPVAQTLPAPVEAASDSAAPPTARAAAAAIELTAPEPESQPSQPDAVTTDSALLSETFWEVDVAPDGLENEPTWDMNIEPYQVHERVQYYVKYFQDPARERFDVWLNRMPRWESMIRGAFREAGLPEDFVYLAIVESGYSNTAVSCAGAVGMWQFIYSTGRLYDLEVNRWIDERRDPFRATRAAAAYLADLTAEFGSHYLAAAAYNGGPGRVRRGIARLASQSTGPSDDTFFELASSRRYLRLETRDYVPKFIAAAMIAKEPNRYGFFPNEPLAPWQFDEVPIVDATGLDVIAELADTSVQAILELNPQFIRGITPPGREVSVRVPAGRGESVRARYRELPASERVNSVDHVIRRGETLGGLSKRYSVPLRAIQEANRGVDPRRLRVGQRVMIPTSGTIVPAAAWADGDGRPQYPRRCGRSYRVRRGDTMSHIATRFGVSLTALLRANQMRSSDVLRAGATIRIPSR